MHTALARTVPLQYYQASFDRYYPSRQNGWAQHQIVFTRDVIQESNASPVFNYNQYNGRIDILEEGYMMCVEIFWKGRAPWGYHMVWLYRNNNPELGYPDEGSLCHCSTQEECESIHSYKSDKSEIGRRICNDKGYWSSHNGHLRCYFITSSKNDYYVINNTPAHIQGTPACFEVKISAFKDPKTIKMTLAPSTVSVTDQLAYLIDSSNDIVDLYNSINELLKRDNYTHTFQNDQFGVTAKELIDKIERKVIGDANTIQKIKDLLCVNGKLHDTSGIDNSASVVPSYRCWACRSALNEKSVLIEERLQAQILAVDEDLYGKDVTTNSVTYNLAANAAFHRGVSVKWLKQFCTYYDCWNWPTWRVVYNIIKPQTSGLRCRYIELPGINANVGAVDIFVSHSWGGCFGDLVAAAFNCISDDGDEEGVKDIRVYIDIFAVRQWPGNNNDVVFEGVVAKVRAVLVVCSSAELENIGELSFKDINDRFLDVLHDQERRAIPFLRIWCLAEINSAVVQHIPLVIACGTYCFDIRTKKKIIFQTNTPLLYNMQFLVSTRDARAEFIADQVNILGKVESGVGFDQVDRQVRGAIVGALVYSKVSIVRKASVGSSNELMQALDEYYSGKTTQNGDIILQALCASAAAGFTDIFNTILEYNRDSKRPLPLLLMQDCDGLTALMHACRSGQRLIIASIKAQVTTKEFNQLIGMMNNDQWTALAFAAQFGCVEIIQALLDGVDDVKQLVNMSLSGGQVALGIGLQNNCSLACCKLLIDAGTNLEHRDGIGYTVIRHAVTPGKNPELVKALLDANANPNEVDNWGASILMWGLEGTVESLKVLLEYMPSNPDNQCDVNMISVNGGKSPLDKAIDLQNSSIIELLKGLGAMTSREMMEKSGKGGCGKLLQSNIQKVMDKFQMTEAEAGLALSSRNGRLDWTLSESSKEAFPRPHDVVTMDALKRGRGHSVMVYRNSNNWSHSDEVDGGELSVGYTHNLNRQCVIDNKVNVTWHRAQKTVHYHNIENEMNSELRFAPYYYVQ